MEEIAGEHAWSKKVKGTPRNKARTSVMHRHILDAAMCVFIGKFCGKNS